ncbi:DUF1992 domain-containing protein [Actinopolymorpha sp. B17G11]|uniref:DnaJ family domain-containing protein n=1 Tax=Actinopolymorpha sp. B17G11 TaxID=3160861 RepID=UPI0032E4EB79
MTLTFATFGRAAEVTWKGVGDMRENGTMTERKPPGISFESWVDKQINDAVARGEFDNLPGAGKPIADLDKPYDEVWVLRHLRKEGVSTEDLLPTPLQLRKEIERLPDTVRELRSEQDVRAVVDELNHRITRWLRAPSGPRVPVVPVKADAVVGQWRADREEAAAKRAAARNAAAEVAPEAGVPAQRTPWWRRLARRRTPTS